MTKVINGKEIASEIINNVKNEIEKTGAKIKVAIISVGDYENNRIYLKQKEKQMQFAGIGYEIKHFDNILQDDLNNLIISYSENSDITGIILQLPVPKEIDSKTAINFIDYKKDIDGLCSANFERTMSGKYAELIPCTAKAVLHILKKYNIDIENKKICFVGKGNLCNKPLSAILKNQGAFVDICDSKTTNLKQHTLDADIIISAVGKNGIVTDDMIKENSVVIDVGITRTTGGLRGDCDIKSSKPYLITPVPNGVGPVTVAMLILNSLIAYKLQKNLI